MLNKLLLFLPQDLSNIIIQYLLNHNYNQVLDSILYHNSILLQLNYDISGPNLLKTNKIIQSRMKREKSYHNGHI